MSACARAHLRPAAPPDRSRASRNVGSASSAIRCASTVADRYGDTRGAVAMNRQRLNTSGSVTAHSMAWKPPMELPIRRSTELTPNALRTTMDAVTISRTVTFGKSRSQGFPVSGFSRAGPSEP